MNAGSIDYINLRRIESKDIYNEAGELSILMTRSPIYG
jgi:hypothetical protein